MESQLRALETRVLASADTMEPLPIVPGGMSVSSIRIPRRLWASSTWEALQQDGTTNHLATREQGLLGSTYELAFIMRRYREQYEIRDATFRLASLPIPLTPDIKSNLLREMSGQLGQTKAGVVYASQLITNLRMSGLAPSDGEIDATFSISNGQTATTIQYCKERGLPLADWRAEVAKVNPAVLAR